MAKRIFSVLLCLALAVSVLCTAVDAKKASARGDVNGDGQCTAIDYIALKRHTLGTFRMPEDWLERADVNLDGAVNATDYIIVKRVVLGTYSFPEEEPVSDALTAAVTLSVLLKNGSEELLQLQGQLNMETEDMETMLVEYFASLSMDSSDIAELEDTVTVSLQSQEEVEAFAQLLADLITEWLLASLNGARETI